MGYVIIGVLLSASLLLYTVVNTKEALWSAQHQLMDDKTEAETFSHNAAVQILQMTAELEAHLAEEIEWDKQERQYFERVVELQEELRINMGGMLGQLKDQIKKALETGVRGTKADEILNALEPVVKNIQTDSDKAIGDFGDSMQNLGQMYLDYIKKESARDKDRLAVLHEKVSTFSKQAGLAAVNTLSDEQLDAKLFKFLKNADSETDIAYAMELPEPVVASIKLFRDQFDLMDQEMVRAQIHDMLFPQGKLDQESKYGAPAYRGGSIEGYLDRLLFLHRYRTELHPQLHAMARKWQDRKITSAEFLQFMLAGVEKGTYPAKWLLGF